MSNDPTTVSKKNTFLFIGTAVCMLVGLIIISELFLRFVVAPSDNFYKQLNFYHSVDDVRIAAFGDSRLSQGFYPFEDSGVVNLAYASENFEQVAQKLGYFLESKKADKIILQVGHHMFADYRFDDDRRDYQVFFSPEQPWRKKLYLQDPELRGHLLDYWTLFFLGGFKIPNQSEFSENGAVLLDMQMTMPPTEDQYYYRKTRIEEHTLKDGFENRATWDELRDTIKRIKDKNIPLCLVSFPVTPFYSEPVSELEHTQAAFDKIKTIAHEERVPYLMYWDYYGDDTSLFRNLDHLNKQGAREFAQSLVEDCGF
ncbi:MAG: hypothetical protein JKY71_01330 [Alphaproteobacteria bacterium]|nr:hypothetical protein [Alphaproteobacteria bacterium]